MNFSPIKPDVVKYEMRMVSGDNPFAEKQKTPGAFGRFLSGVGKFFGSVSLPLSFVFPPAAIAAAGMYGVGTIGDQMQSRAYMKAAQQQQQGALPVSYPGLDLSPTASNFQMSGGPIQPLSAKQEAVMDVLFARNDMMLDSAHRV